MRRGRPAALLLLGTVLAGCAVTDPSRYYVLGAGAPAAATRPATEGASTIGVGPVAVPAYLERLQLVTRDASGRLEIWPYHRWAEPLDAGIAQALAEVIAAQVPSDRVAVFPWRGTLARTIDYQVVVAVARFEGSPGGPVNLDARWRLLSREGRELAFKRSTVTEAVTGEGFAALVAAMHRALGQVGAEMAEAIRSQPANRASVRP